MIFGLNIYLRIILCILSSYRITELISLDDGPFGIFRKFRKFLGKRGSKGELNYQLAILITCPFCLGIWISSVMSLLIFFPTVIGDIFLIVMSISGGQTVLESLNRRHDDQ